MSRTDLDITLRNGGGEAVILVHGMTGAPDEMRFLGKKLHDRGFDVHIPLLAGHGAGYPDIRRTGWADWLGTVKATYERIRGDYDRVHIAGICAGGMLGLLLARDHDIASCTIYAPVFDFDGWTMSKFYANLRWGWRPIQLAPLVGRIVVPETYPFGLKDTRLRTLAAESQDSLIKGALDGMPLKSIADMYELGQVVLKAAPSLSVSTLIIHAEEDEIGHPDNARRLQRALGGPARLEMLQDSYHMIHVDRERSKVVALTLAHMTLAQSMSIGRPEAAGRKAHA
jgi:carboxylesterase